MDRSIRSHSIDLYDESSNLSTASTETVTRSQKSKPMKKVPPKEDMKFMENFNPETSNRERRKLTRKITHGRKHACAYDEKGILVSSGKDLCDCLDEKCVGCHFPCPKCRSNKCGQECRVNRKYMYDQIEVEGTDIIIKNKYK